MAVAAGFDSCFPGISRPASAMVGPSLRHPLAGRERRAWRVAAPPVWCRWPLSRRAAASDEPTLHPDPNDRASRETDITLELRSRDRESKLITKIDEALERIEAGDYGYCDVCGVEIGIERLEARPTAELCIDCKTLDEIREKQMA